MKRQNRVKHSRTPECMCIVRKRIIDNSFRLKCADTKYITVMHQYSVVIRQRHHRQYLCGLIELECSRSHGPGLNKSQVEATNYLIWASDCFQQFSATEPHRRRCSISRMRFERVYSACISLFIFALDDKHKQTKNTLYTQSPSISLAYTTNGGDKHSEAIFGVQFIRILLCSEWNERDREKERERGKKMQHTHAPNTRSLEHCIFSSCMLNVYIVRMISSISIIYVSTIMHHLLYFIINLKW